MPISALHFYFASPEMIEVKIHHRQTDKILDTIYGCVCGFFLQVKFAISLLASLSGGLKDSPSIFLGGFSRSRDLKSSLSTNTDSGIGMQMFLLIFWLIYSNFPWHQWGRTDLNQNWPLLPPLSWKNDCFKYAYKPSVSFVTIATLSPSNYLCHGWDKRVT